MVSAAATNIRLKMVVMEFPFEYGQKRLVQARL